MFRHSAFLPFISELFLVNMKCKNQKTEDRTIGENEAALSFSP